MVKSEGRTTHRSQKKWEEIAESEHNIEIQDCILVF